MTSYFAELNQNYSSDAIFFTIYRLICYSHYPGSSNRIFFNSVLFQNRYYFHYVLGNNKIWFEVEIILSELKTSVILFFYFFVFNAIVPILSALKPGYLPLHLNMISNLCALKKSRRTHLHPFILHTIRFWKKSSQKLCGKLGGKPYVSDWSASFLLLTWRH
jgi:hypothetical protein